MRELTQMLDRIRAANERVFPDHLFLGPRNIVLGVNNFCNLRCLMCDVGTDNNETNFGGNLMGSKSRSMPIDLFRHIADEVAEFCPTAQLAFVFTEPLAWMPLGSALQYAQKKGIQTAVMTNGLLLPRRAPELAGFCASLGVSLDGTERIHDHIRRRQGSYLKAVEGIRNLSALDPRVQIGVFCTITEWNVGHLKEFMSAMAVLPIQSVGLIHNNFVTHAQADEHNLVFDGLFHATPSSVFEANPQSIDLELLAKELGEISRTSYPFRVIIQPRCTELNDLQTYYHRPEVRIGKRCRDAFSILMIDSDGEAIPAHGRCFRFPIANIRDTSLGKIWNHRALSSLRKTLCGAGGLMPACTRCCGGFG